MELVDYSHLSEAKKQHHCLVNPGRLMDLLPKRENIQAIMTPRRFSMVYTDDRDVLSGVSCI
jgi:hypothetical protein